MPTHSVKTNATVTTIRTVDDVFSRIDDELHPDASLSETRDKVRRLTYNNPSLEKETLEELHSASIYFDDIVVNIQSLLKSMYTHKALLGGVQATSFFYPLCEVHEAPWDFFVSNRGGSGDLFINSMTQFGGVEHIETVKSDNGLKVVYFRRYSNARSQPINIRIYVSDDHPISMILSQPESYRQSFISATNAVCFWPRLNRKGLYRVFDGNKSRFDFPSGKTRLTINIKKMSRTVPKKPSSSPSIYTGEDKRIEIVTLKNECGANKGVFKSETLRAQNIVYAISDKSSKYLGDIANM